MASKDSSQALKCSFCGKSQKQVIKLIAGPGVYICDECIELCVEIIEEEKVEKLETTPEEYLPLPKEINQSLNEYIIGQEDAKKTLIDKYGWRDYGGKHYESIFTRFFHAFYLLKKFFIG